MYTHYNHCHRVIAHLQLNLLLLLLLLLLFGATLPLNKPSPDHISSVVIYKSRTSLPLGTWNKQVPYTNRRGPTWAIEHRLLSLGSLTRVPSPATCVTTQQLLQCCVELFLSYESGIESYSKTPVVPPEVDKGRRPKWLILTFRHQNFTFKF
jgi:hypothetical protein